MPKVLLLLLLASVGSATGCASWPFDWFSDYYSAGDDTYSGKKQHFEEQQSRFSLSPRIP